MGREERKVAVPRRVLEEILRRLKLLEEKVKRSSAA